MQSVEFWIPNSIFLQSPLKFNFHLVWSSEESGISGRLPRVLNYGTKCMPGNSKQTNFKYFFPIS